MGANYSREERRRLAEAAAEGKPLRCPVCGGGLARRRVEPGRGVGYVRRRSWVLCPACKRSAAVDVRPGARP